jgi:hypothetical protein
MRERRDAAAALPSTPRTPAWAKGHALARKYAVGDVLRRGRTGQRAGEESRTFDDESRTVDEDTRIAGDDTRIAGDDTRIAGDEPPVADDEPSSTSVGVPWPLLPRPSLVTRPPSR